MANAITQTEWPRPQWTVPEAYDGEHGPVCGRCNLHLADVECGTVPLCAYCVTEEDADVMPEEQYRLFIDILSGLARPHHLTIFV